MRCENALRTLTIMVNSSSTSHYGSEIELTCVYLVKYCLNRGGRPARLQLGFFWGGESMCDKAILRLSYDLLGGYPR